MPSHVELYRDHPRNHRSDTLLQWLHIQAGTPPSTQVRPTIPTENRLNFGLDNYFSIGKAQRDLGYQPLFTTEQAMAECLPYYVDLFHQMKSEATPHAVTLIKEEPVKG
jgi:3beta-hydroxy-Delta5-steroid dehydrogenase / steroid Delta-isomerase